MGADYYRAETENGDHIDDPSEDGLFMLLSELNREGNSFVNISPAGGGREWYVSISILPNGTYEVLRMVGRGPQEVFVRETADQVAHETTLWLAEPDDPGRPVSSS
jgi:hypothetical protein